MIRINKQLLESASFNPTKKTYQISIANLCEKIEQKNITLPLYQRDVSWSLPKCVELLNYQLLGKAPVSPISINQMNSEFTVTQVSFIEREIITDVKMGQHSVADGQQRLTTNFKAYENSEEFKNIVLDIVKGQFQIIEAGIKKHQIPVGILLNKNIKEFFDYINSNQKLRDGEVMNLLIQVRNKLRDYNYTINLAEDLTEEEQITWFEVLNNAGSKVTRIQMSFAKLKIYGIDIYIQYTKPFKEKLEAAGLEDLFKIKDTEVSFPVCALNSAYEVTKKMKHSKYFTPIPSDVREKRVFALEPNQIQTCFRIALEALDNTIDFLSRTEVKKPDRLDYITYILGLFTLRLNKELSEYEDEILIEWYNTVSFRNASNGERRAIFTDLLNLFDIETDDTNL